MPDFREKAREAARRSYSPYSGVEVGCVLETDRGELHAGANIENASFSLTMCAERVALFKAVSEGASAVRRVHIWSNTGFFLPPCGACLQVLSEWMTPDGEVVLIRSDGERKTVPFRDLFPMDLANLREHLR